MRSEKVDGQSEPAQSRMSWSKDKQIKNNLKERMAREKDERNYYSSVH